MIFELVYHLFRFVHRLQLRQHEQCTVKFEYKLEDIEIKIVQSKCFSSFLFLRLFELELVELLKRSVD